MRLKTTLTHLGHPKYAFGLLKPLLVGFLASGNVTTRAVSQVFSKNAINAFKAAGRRLLQAEAGQAVRDMASDNGDDFSQR